ncbi:MAG: plastocyanin/azurin family copper-binding protein [Dehalococcoidia bacterium]
MTARGARWRSIFSLVALLGVVALAGCGTTESTPASAAATDAGGPSVTIRLFQFQPATLDLAAGETVTWTNRDDILHTVTSGTPDARDGRFDGAMNGAGTTYTITFSEPGTYAYFCSRHESMRGEVRVQ